MLNVTNVADIFQLMEALTAWKIQEPLPENHTKEEQGFSPGKYLQKGERILSLLKEKSKNGNTEKPVLSILSPKSMQSDNAISYALKRIQKNIAEPMLKEASLSANMQSLEQLFPGIPVTLTIIPECSMQETLIQAICRQKDAISVKIQYTQETEAITCLNYPVRKKYRHTNSYLKSIGKESQCYVVDFSEELSKWILASQTIQYLKDLGEKYAGDVVAEFCIMYLNKSMSICTEDGTLSLNSNLGNQHGFISWLDKQGMPYCIASPGHKGKTLDYTDTALFDLLHGHSITKPECLRQKLLPEGIMSTFRQVYAEYAKDIRTQTFFQNMGKEYAHVYETKKDIPNKVVKAMGNSGFNDFFGYVEFDPECNLASMKEIELEFRAMQTIFLQGKHEEVSLRFRKLGHYKASGLYFPLLKCLCVDVRVPSSMAHEYLHMIDHEHGNLSRKAAFQPVYRQYVALLEDAISKIGREDPMYAQWNGNKKYNRKYYTEPTEVFARCGEIYLTAIRNVHNSICKPEESFVYPKEPHFLASAKAYYESLFESFTKERKERKKKNENGTE